MIGKTRVYHFHNGTGGGTLSVIKNLLLFSQKLSIENHVIYSINKDIQNGYEINHLKGAVSETVFYYSSRWNFYYTCKQLAKLLPDDKAVIVAHDWLELGMASNLGLQNPLIYFLHGDYEYYYHLAQIHQAAVDGFIAIAGSISVKLKTLIPYRQNDIYYHRFPVPILQHQSGNRNGRNIIFIGRLTHDKGYDILPAIDRLLKENNLQLNWHIVGQGTPEIFSQVVWDKESSVHFYGSLQNEKVLSMLSDMDYFILPSLNEGMPVSLIEAMKSGVIPLVNNIDGGIQELVLDNITGYKINNNHITEYAERITLLVKEKGLAESIRANASKLADTLFDPDGNTRQIEDVIMNKYLKVSGNKQAKKVYGSRLDIKWLPNLITKSVRSFK